MSEYRIYELMLDCRKVGHHITQKDLAEAVGIQQSAIHKLIHGHTKFPKPQVLLTIAEVFSKALGRKITIDDLIAKNGDTADAPPDIEPPAQQLFEQFPSQYDSLGEGETMKIKDAIPVADEDFVPVPIFGHIPCGDPLMVQEEDILGYEWIHKDMVGRGKFFLRAQGASMSPRIEDGDLILIEPGDEWKNGTTVVVFIDGDVTCKNLFLSNGQAMLVPENRRYTPIIVTGEMRVIGRVTTVVTKIIKDWRPYEQ